MNAFIAHMLPILLGLLIKITLLLLVPAVVCRVLRRSSAATRHLVWTAAIGGILLLPILSLSLPHWNVAWSHAARSSASALLPAKPVPAKPVPSTDVPSDDIQIDSTKASNTVPTQATETTPPSNAQPELASPAETRRPYPILLLCAVAGCIVWSVGFLLVLGQFFIGLRRIGQIRQQAVSLDEASLVIAEEAQRRFGLRPVTFLRAKDSNSVAVPVTWGLLHPVVLLPAQSTEWSEDCLRAALLHEMAHVQRRDWATQVAARIACALYWWHPLVWWAVRQARAESERACDDLVLGTGMKAADYAQRLVDVVRSMPAGAASQTVAIAMAQPSEVEGRVRAVLAKKGSRKPITRRLAASVFVICLLMVLPLAALRPIAHAQAPDTLPADTVERRTPRGILTFVYFKDVSCQRDPNRPITLAIEAARSGQDTYRFQDRRTGLSFRDGPTIQATFQQVLAEGTGSRPGTTSYLIPLPLSINVSSRQIFFTPDQRRRADALEREKEAWLDLLQTSPVIDTDADIDHASAMQGGFPMQPALKIIYTSAGAKKLAVFTTHHTREVMGVIIDGKLVTAPMINEPIVGGEAEISGGFRTPAEVQALAKRLNESVSTEIIGQGFYRGISPKGVVTSELRGGNGDPAPVAQGYQATLPNGYTLDIVGLTQAVAQGTWWNMCGGAWWQPNGTPLAQSLGAKDWKWRIKDNNSLAPYVLSYTIMPPGGTDTNQINPAAHDFSVYHEFFGTANPDWLASFSRSNNDSNEFAATFFPPGAKTCSLRVGVAAGPWQTVGTVPAHFTPATVKTVVLTPPDNDTAVTLKLDDRPTIEYLDVQGKPHSDSFLENGSHLENVARRFVAVDDTGQVIPLKEVAGGYRGVGYYLLGFSKTSHFAAFNSQVDLTHVKEFRLQTRPYQIVEFRNIQLQPLTAVGGNSGQAQPASIKQTNNIQTGGGLMDWIVLPSTATTSPFTYEHRIGSILRQVVYAEKGYDPSTATLRQVTLTEYHNGRITEKTTADDLQRVGRNDVLHNATIRYYARDGQEVSSVHDKSIIFAPALVPIVSRHISPLPGGMNGNVIASAYAATSFRMKSWQDRQEMSSSNMKRIGLMILRYALDHHEHMPSLKTISSLEKDLTPYMKYVSMGETDGHFMQAHAQGNALFISPLTGKPYRPVPKMSHVPLSNIEAPASTILFTDTPSLKPDGTRWLLQEFTDGSVKGKTTP